MISDNEMCIPNENDRSGQNVWARIKPYVEEMIQFRLQAELQPIRERLTRLEQLDRTSEPGFDQSGMLEEIRSDVKRLLEWMENKSPVRQSSIFSAGLIKENKVAATGIRPEYTGFGGANEYAPAIQTAKETTQLYYLKNMNIEGGIPLRSTRLIREEACFELETIDGRTATLIPLIEQSGFLIMQLDYLLRPAFEITRRTSGNGDKIRIIEPARYELQNDWWVLLRKGLLEIVGE